MKDSEKDPEQLRAEERALVAAWFGYLSSEAYGPDPTRPVDRFVAEAFAMAASALTGGLGMPPGGCCEPMTAKATKPAGPMTLEQFRTHREPRS